MQPQQQPGQVGGQPMMLQPAMLQAPPGHRPVLFQGHIVFMPMAQAPGGQMAVGAQPVMAVQQGMAQAANPQQQLLAAQAAMQQHVRPMQPGTMAQQVQQVQPNNQLVAQLQAHQQRQALLHAQQRHAAGGLGAMQVAAMPRGPAMPMAPGAAMQMAPVVRPAAVPAASVGFTPGQLECLRQQILAFKQVGERGCCNTQRVSCLNASARMCLRHIGSYGDSTGMPESLGSRPVQGVHLPHHHPCLPT
jgi:hypothetical protein